MKKILFTLCLVFTGSVLGYSQSVTIPAHDTKAYEEMKAAGKFSPLSDGQIKVFQPTFEELKNLGTSHKMAGGGCGCYITPDATYTVAMAPNDDGSTG